MTEPTALETRAAKSTIEAQAQIHRTDDIARDAVYHDKHPTPLEDIETLRATAKACQLAAQHIREWIESDEAARDRRPFGQEHRLTPSLQADFFERVHRENQVYLARTINRIHADITDDFEETRLYPLETETERDHIQRMYLTAWTPSRVELLAKAVTALQDAL